MIHHKHHVHHVRLIKIKGNLESPVLKFVVAKGHFRVTSTGIKVDYWTGLCVAKNDPISNIGVNHVRSLRYDALWALY